MKLIEWVGDTDNPIYNGVVSLAWLLVAWFTHDVYMFAFCMWCCGYRMCLLFKS